MIFLHKFILTNKFIKHTPFWWWWRLISHQGFRFDDYHVWAEFWHSLNDEWEHMEYVNKFEEFWGKGSYPPERIVIPKENFDALIERLNQPSDPKVIERLKEIMSKKAPWDS
jgi:hypothetical protein